MNNFDIKNFTVASTVLLTGCSLLMILHYLFSYYLFLTLLEPLNLSMSSILSLEDIIFSLGPLNIRVLPLLLFSYIVYFLFLIFVSVFIREQILQKAKWICRIKDKIQKLNHSCTGIKKRFIFITLIAFVFFWCWILYSCAPPVFWLIYCLILILTTLFLFFILGYFENHNSFFILLGILIYVLCVAVAYKSIFPKNKYNRMIGNKIEVVFNDEKRISTNENNYCVYLGSKYAIFADSCNNATLYPISTIKRVRCLQIEK